MEKNTATENIEFEEISTGQLPHSTEAIEAKVLTADDIAKNEIKKFNIADAAIAEMKKQYGGLKITGIDDRDGYKKVKAAWQIVRNKRLQVEKVHKIIKADYLTVSRAIDGEKNRLLDLISPLENELGDELERVDNLIELEKQKAEREAQERLQTRVADLLANGVQFNGSYYAIGETISIDVVTLKNLKDEDFNKLFERVQAENKKIVETREAEEQRQREERERHERERQELIENNRKLEEQRQELERQKKEFERQQAEAKKQRTDLRVQILLNAGFKSMSRFASEPVTYIFETPDAGNILVYLNDFEELEGDAWDAKFLEIRADVNRLRALQAEKDEEKREQQRQEELRQKAEAEKRDRWNARAKELFSMGMHERKGEFYIITDSFGETNFIKAAEYFDKGAATWANDLVDIEATINETRRQDEQNKKEAAEKKEAERLAAMSDAEILNEYFVKLADVKTPTFKNGQVEAAFKLFVDSYRNAKDTLFKTLELISKK